MTRAEDIKFKPEKPFNSILPFLRAEKKRNTLETTKNTGGAENEVDESGQEDTELFS